MNKEIEKEFSKRFDKKFVAMLKGEAQWGISAEICQFISKIRQLDRDKYISELVELECHNQDKSDCMPEDRAKTMNTKDKTSEIIGFHRGTHWVKFKLIKALKDGKI